MDKAEAVNKLIEFKAEALKFINIKKMFLYGSYSQGRQRPESDIDVAIVVDKIQGDYFEYLTMVWKIAGDLDCRIEPVVFEENQPDLSGFYENIVKTGVEIN